MFVILLKFAERRSRAAEFMEAHREWIRRGFDDGAFMLVGSLGSGGGAILAAHTSMEAMQARVAADPFVIEGVVAPEIHEILPSQFDERLGFLKAA
jgi:uncharacterized protein YciI